MLPVKKLFSPTSVWCFVLITMFGLALCQQALCQTGTSAINPGGDSSWIKATNIYEIFVDRFGGDLPGVTGKLDYLAELGVKTIWLMPIFEAMSDHGYNTTNYYAIESRYGTIADLTQLVQTAHAKGIRVILDLVMNHCGTEHLWFSASTAAERKDHWFIWASADLGWPDSWEDSKQGNFPMATWFRDPQADLDRDHNGNPHDDDYYFGLFGDSGGATMPDLNFNDPASQAELLNEFENIMRFWVQQADVDGFRCDAVRYVSENGRGHQTDQPETHAIWKELRKRLVNIKPGAILLAEAPTDNYDQMIGYYGTGDEFHSAFHFKLQYTLMATLRNERRPFHLLSELYDIQGRLPAGTQDTIFLSNHDSFAGDRVATQLGNHLAKMKSAASLYLLLSGNPAIYYGEEIGMLNGAGSGDARLRHPMDWEAAQAQQSDPNSLLNHYTRLLRLRNTYDALRGGITYFVPTHSNTGWDGSNSDSATLSIIREFFGEKILVVHNFSSMDQAMHVDFTNSGLTIPSDTEVHALMGAGSYPPVNNTNKNYYGLGTVYGFTTKVIFLGDLGKYQDVSGKFLTYENAIHSEIPDAWYFRGTPNNWGATGMTLNSQGLWETIQTFGDNNPRFKISHYGDNWNESYPASDYLITEGTGTYKITFNSASKQVVAVVKQPTGPTVTIHYREFQPASSYSIHVWDGITGDFVMEYEGYFQSAHWWKGTLNNIPANFKFCFRNSNGNWDGVNREYSGQSHDIYSVAFSSDAYLVRP